MTNATDAGKRLSEKELAEMRSFAKSLDGNYWINIDKDRLLKNQLALLSHIAAITANRGSVSEERAREILAQKQFDRYEDRITSARIEAGGNALISCQVAIAAIQQAVSECSGDGAEEITKYTAEQQRVVDYIQQIAPGLGGGDDPIGFLIAAHNFLAEKCSALPLPPSLVRKNKEIPEMTTDTPKRLSDVESCECKTCVRDGRHTSDCAVHNAPAFPKGKCDCGRLSALNLLRLALEEIKDASLPDQPASSGDDADTYARRHIAKLRGIAAAALFDEPISSPSPVKESRDAVIETLETIRYVCKNCMGGDGIKTIDELASVAINTLKTTPHQGGEGK